MLCYYSFKFVDCFVLFTPAIRVHVFLVDTSILKADFSLTLKYAPDLGERDWPASFPNFFYPHVF